MSSSVVSVSSSSAAPPGTTFADVACFITHLPSSHAASQALFSRPLPPFTSSCPLAARTNCAAHWEAFVHAQPDALL